MSNIKSNSNLVIVLTTEGDSTKASTLAKNILYNKLAICISFSNISSNYFWQGELVESNEVQLTIKTIPEKLNSLLEKIEDLHSYQIPELIYWSGATSTSYGKWAEAVVRESYKLL